MEGGWLASLARTLLALIGVCALAWISLQWLSRRSFVLGGQHGPRRLRLVAQLPLGARRQLYLVEADSKLLLLGAGDTGPLSLIAELPQHAREAAASTLTAQAQTPTPADGGRA